MARHKSIINMSLDSPMHQPSISSSPLRRKTVFPHNTMSKSPLVENDDEAERLARRKSLSSVTSTTSANTSDKRRSLGLSFLVHMPAAQMAERISQCIKLGAENKINPKNAFSLDMIDFMTYMIKKQDKNMSNLQVASTSLDVSTKIYGFRVDGVHMEILKMMGGLGKQDKDDKNQNALGMDCQDEDTNTQAEKQDKKKKKLKKIQQIFTTVEALKTNIEIEKPSLITMDADLQTTDMLYQVLLPNHAHSKFYPHPYNDILIDEVGSKEIEAKDTVRNIPRLTDFSQMEICHPLFHFDFQSWNADDELEEVQPEKNNESRFEFDLDASDLHPNNEDVYTNHNRFLSDECAEEDIDRCAMISKPVENIVDFRNVLSNLGTSETSEYTYIQASLNVHWAGPCHWKVTNFRKILSNSKVVETCRQEPVRKKKEIELHYDDEVIKNANAKVAPSEAKLNSKTVKVEWSEEVLTLPPDEHYDIAQANKLYLHNGICDNKNSIIEANVSCSSDNVENCNYGDVHDELVCYPNTNNDDHQINETFANQMAFTGDNLVTIPKLTNKLSITYCTRAKKIDMRQLKRSIWTCLTSDEDVGIREKENEEVLQQNSNSKVHGEKNFSMIYKKLPNFLTRNNIQALSFPISFVSLLHLANEKLLKITSCSELSDFIVQQD